jgi:serine/threonine protein kinase/Tol biopolymer transport system component
MEQWQQVSRLFHEALQRGEANRAAFLDGACGDDQALRREVESLLTHDGDTVAFLAAPATASPAPASERATNRSSMIGREIAGYRVVSLLGVGGMGEVYRAHDPRLGRDIAIKVLPPSFAHDPERVSRFAREARVLAALNHPHIATIHGLEEADGVRALVMELVEGPTLADRPGPDGRRSGNAARSMQDALQIAEQIAEALEEAHENGIIHRDLKPANVKLTRDGHVKVLDFGLAKAFSPDAGGSDLSRTPTITATHLRPGAILGTPAYMSPEQARGQVVDKRTDIWAFGCVLYELLTGRCAFDGETTSDIIAAVIERDPDWHALPACIGLDIRRLLRRCLQKDPNLRLHDIADARIEIREALSSPHVSEPAAASSAAVRRETIWRWAPAVVALATATAATAAWVLPRAPAAAPEVRLEITTPATTNPGIAVSPDGSTIVFTVRSAGQSQLWLRPLHSSVGRPLAGTERGVRPFWSPDGQSIGFQADGRLKRVDVDGGAVVTLAGAGVALGATWNKAGIILFANNPGGPIYRVSATGGEPVAATSVLAPQQRGHSAPQFLPGGRDFLFFVTGSPEGRGVYVGQLGRTDTKHLLDADTPAVYAPSGQLLFIRDGKLLAQAFDVDRLELRGRAFEVGESASSGTRVSAGTGVIAYRTPSDASRQRQLVWVDRSGRELNKVVYPDDSALGPALSPDGRQVAVFRHVNGNMDLWSFDTRTRAWDRVTFDPGDDIDPLWSADGKQIVFGSARGTPNVNLYRKLLGEAPGSEQLLLETSEGKFPTDLSRDGRFVLYDRPNPRGDSDMWALPLDSERKPLPVVQTEFTEGLGQFSPDGRWVAYQSDRSGRLEVYIRAFPGPGPDIMISVDGGGQARWSADGRELFYIGADDRMMAVPLQFSNHNAVQAGMPAGLFATTIGSTADNVYRQQYAVAPDGQSFLLNSMIPQDPASPIKVILNWKPQR